MIPDFDNVTEALDTGQSGAVIDRPFYLSLTHLLIGIFGMCGNMMVIIILGSSSTLRRQHTVMYIINQSAIDLVSSIMIICLHDVSGVVPFDGLAGEIYCRLWQSEVLLWSFLTSSTMNLVFITLNRYMKLVHPMWYKVYFGQSKVKFSLIFSWFYGPLITFPASVPTSHVQDGICLFSSMWPSALTKVIFGIIAISLHYLLPLILFVCFYVRIIYTLHRHMKQNIGINMLGVGDSRTNLYCRSRMNTIKTLLVVALCFVVCWTPDQIYFLRFNLGYPCDFTSTMYHIFVLMVFINCIINPLIYIYQYEPLRQSGRQLWIRMRCSKEPERNDQPEVSSISSMDLSQVNNGESPSEGLTTPEILLSSVIYHVQLREA